MKLKKGIILMVIASMAFASCKDSKNDTTPVVTKTKTDLITTGSWMMSDMLLNGASIYALSDACSKDDFMTFKTNATVITDEGATKCSVTDPQTTTDNWKFYNNEKKIIVGTDTSDLNLLSETNMEIGFKDSADVIVVKFKKK